MKGISMDAIYELCPSLKKMEFSNVHSAIVRMCIAHVINGGAYVGFYETAKNYLESLR